MTDAFVPLVAGAQALGKPTGPARLKPVSPPPSAFEVSNTSNLKAAPSPSSAGSPPAACEPKITLERQGETVTHIRIQCSCGQVTELKCEY